MALAFTEERLSCPICLETYRRPQSLRCGHLFCTPCIEELLERNGGGYLQCSLCRTLSELRDIRRDFTMEEMVEAFRNITVKTPEKTQPKVEPKKKQQKVEIYSQHKAFSGFESSRMAIEGTTLRYTGRGCQNYDVGVFKGTTPVLTQGDYFELEILDPGCHSYIAIGLVSRNYSMDVQPGWMGGSVAFHADDGQCSKGDRMGVGVNAGRLTPGTVASVYFTKNGHRLGSENVVVPRSGFYPAIGLHSIGERVKVVQGNVFSGNSSENTTPKRLNMSVCRTAHLIVENDVLRYTGNGRNDYDVGVLKGSVPIANRKDYFEIEIIHSGCNGFIAIGLVSKDYALNRQPGWDEESYAYHADDGNLYESYGRGRTFGETCTVGDRMGVGTEADQVIPGKSVTLYFTKNGNRFGSVKAVVPRDGLYPALGLHSVGERVKVLQGNVLDLGDSGVNTQKIGDCRTGQLAIEQDILRYTGSGRCDFDVGVFKSSTAFVNKNDYFELEIINAGCNSFIAIGLVSDHYALNRQPGWDPVSYAYHADDGNLYESCGFGRRFAESCTTGDRMGVGVEAGQLVPGNRASIYFTKNGDKIGNVDVRVPAGGFYPAIGLHSVGEKVRILRGNVFE